MAAPFIAHIGAGILGGTVGAATRGSHGPIGRASDQWFNAQFPNEIPGIPEAMHAYRAGLLPGKAMENLMLVNGAIFYVGIPPDRPDQPGWYRTMATIWKRVYQSQEPQPAVGEILTMLNRDIIQLGEADERLHRIGFSDEFTRGKLLQLRFDIPGPADLTRFAVRHVWEPDLIEHFAYNDEFRPAINYWMTQQGMGYDARTPEERDEKRPPYTWGQAQWWAHWILPSPGQGYTMLQRLRPTGGPGGRPRDPSGEVFSAADMKLLLRANDYPPYWRDKLLAISFNPIGLRQLRQLVQYQLIDRPELVERWRDLGFHVTNATLQAELTIRGERDKKFAASVTGTRGRILTAYKIGSMGREAASRLLYLLTLGDPDQVAAYRDLPEAQQNALADASVGVQLALDAIDTDAKSGLVRAAIAATRKMFLQGRIDRGQASNRLNLIGVDPGRRDQYLTLWTLEFTPQRKELQTAVIQRYLRYGIINAIDAATRLSNIGWGADDIPLLLADTLRNVGLDLAKAQAQAARSIQQKARELERVVSRARAEHDRARAELARYSSPSMLQKRYVRGYISDAGFVARLRQLDWPRLEADQALAEAQEARRRALEEARWRAEQRAEEEATEAARAAKPPAPARPQKVPGPTLAMLKAWCADGIISPDAVRQHLKDLNWKQADIDAYMAEVALHGCPPAAAPPGG